MFDFTSLDAALESLCMNLLTETEDLSSAEDKLYDILLSRATYALGNTISTFDEDLFGHRPRTWRVKEKVDRVILTRFGKVTYTKRIYTDEVSCRIHLIDDILGILQRARISPGVKTLLIDASLDTSYPKAAEKVSKLIGHPVSVGSAISAIAEAGALLEEQAQQSRKRLFEQGEVGAGTKHAHPLCVETDGIWVHSKRGRGRNIEIKHGVAYSWERGKVKDRVSFASIRSSHSFWEEFTSRLSNTFDFAKIEHCILGVDAGGWCLQGDRYLPGKCVVKLDLYHASRSIKVCLGKSAQKAQSYLYSDPLLSIKTLGTYLGAKDIDQEKLKSCIRYLSKHLSRLDPHVSNLGTIEGSNAHVIAARMKVYGGAWSDAGAHYMALCRSARYSKDPLQLKARDVFYTEVHEQKAQQFYLRNQNKYHELCDGVKGAHEYPRKVASRTLPSRGKYLANAHG